MSSFAGSKNPAIILFDSIGSYIVDIFYNALYQKAVDSVNRGASHDVTDTYKMFIRSYIDGLKREDLYVKLLRSIFTYYQFHSHYARTMGDFETYTVSLCMPQDSLTLSIPQRDVQLRAILTRSITVFGSRVVQRDMLMRIIDEHHNVENVTILQDIMLNSFMTIREDIYAQFMHIGDETVAVAVLDKANSRITMLTEKNLRQESELQSALQIIETQRRQLKDKDIKMQKLLNTLKACNVALTKKGGQVPVREAPAREAPVRETSARETPARETLARANSAGSNVARASTTSDVHDFLLGAAQAPLSSSRNGTLVASQLAPARSAPVSERANQRNPQAIMRARIPADELLGAPHAANRGGREPLSNPRGNPQGNSQNSQQNNPPVEPVHVHHVDLSALADDAADEVDAIEDAGNSDEQYQDYEDIDYNSMRDANETQSAIQPPAQSPPTAGVGGSAGKSPEEQPADVPDTPVPQAKARGRGIRITNPTNTYDQLYGSASAT